MTGLPDSLQELDINGLNETNFDLSNNGGEFPQSLKTLKVTDASLCCLGTETLEINCYYQHLDEKLECDLLKRLKSLRISAPRELAFFKEGHTQTEGCAVESLSATSAAHVFLTILDIQIFQGCPLKELNMRQTSCFSQSTHVDLSVFTELEKLDLKDCKHTDFLITGLPGALQELDISGLNNTNFDLSNNGGKLPQSLKTLKVTNASLCCLVTDTLEVNCGYSYLDGNAECDLLKRLKLLHLSTQQEMAAMREGQSDGCKVETLSAYFKADFFMKSQDI